MALDVHLTRDVNEKWGFEIVGGADEEVPLTIVKMEPSSPASRGGLQSGDTVFTINGEEALDFTHEEACRQIAECGETLTLGVMRGLYDPVLDDQDPIVYEPGDLDPESQPTEVSFKIQQFVEPSDLGSSPLEYGGLNNPIGAPYDPSVLLSESRSLTASPFMNPTRPYRPFSTEPLPEVPPLEDPIILNPNYKDQFPKNPNNIDPEYILNAYSKENGFGSRYKLPISEQYDPDGTKRVKNTEIDSVLLKYLNMEKLSKHSEKITETIISNVNAETSKQASSSKDIKESMCTNIKEISAQEQCKKDVITSEIIEIDIKTEEVEEKMISEELNSIEKMRQEIDVDQIERTAHSVVDDSIERAVSVAEEIKKEMEGETNLDIDENVETVLRKAEKKLSAKTETQMEMKETDFEVIDKIASNKEHLAYAEEDIHKERETIHKTVDESVYRKDEKQSSADNVLEYKKVSKTYVTDSKSGAQQRLYEIGLQTIPNIRGVVQSSSYHYDLLLRTFFIHLTDVMVALSRFLLSQPVFDNTCLSTSHKTVSESHKKSDIKDVKENKTVKTAKHKVEAEMRDKTSIKSEALTKPVQQVKKRELVTPVSMEETKIESHERMSQAKKEEAIIVQGNKKKVTGAEMAARTEKKITKDVEKKMGAVISEFQTIAVEEDKKEMFQRSRRSRSRSQIEEEVAKESDPLEWLAKVDSRRASQEVSEERLSKKEFSSSETLEKRRYEKLEKHEIKHKKAKTPKQMYVAVVEAHVYTNKDVIFEDAAEFSETSSVQSAEEVSTAFEAMEAMQSETVLIENAVQQIEQAKIVEESQELSKVVAKSEATVQKVEEMVHETTNIQQEEYKEEKAIQSTNIQEVMESVAVDINKLVQIAESSEINIHEAKSEFSSTKMKSESISVIDEDYKESVVVENEVEQEVAKAKTELESQVQIEDVTEKIVLKAEKADITKEEEFAALKIVKEVETEVDTPNEVIEVEEVEVNKIEVSKELLLDQSALVVEESKHSSEISMESQSIMSSEETQLSKELHIDQSAVEMEESKNSSEFMISIDSQSKMTSIVDMSSKSSHLSVENYNYQSESYKSESAIQESSFTAKSVDKKLSLRTDLHFQESIQSAPSTIDTPTPSTVPPTPLTDEYVFKLTIPLPKSRSTTPIPRDCTLSPEEEDPHIVKKKLIPHIETKIDQIIYDPPLPTPPGDGPLSPIFKTPGLFGGSSKPIYKIKFPIVYRKPGLFGGADNPEYSKEEIREIERKSSLLASAIDETIKSIEEYKEEVGMETKKEIKVSEFKEEISKKSFQESYSKETVIESKQNGYQESETSIEETIEKSDSASVDNKATLAIDKAKNESTAHFDNNISSGTTTVKDIEQDINEKLEANIQNLSSEVVKDIDVKIEEPTKPEYIQEKKIAVERFTEESEKMKDIEVAIENQDNSHKAVDKEVKVVKFEEVKKDPMAGFRPVVFDPDSIPKRSDPPFVMQGPATTEPRASSPYLTESGEIIGTVQGIVDGLEKPVMDPEVAKELGKPGISEEKIAELISGEAEMLREAHVMGLSRVLNSHMHRADDSSVDFQKIKPMIDSLKDSEVLKALNEELARQREEERKKEEKRWTTFLQKPKRPPPKAKFGYHGWTPNEQALVEEPYKVKIVKQAKPKVAPDYKPEDFDTGPLPWEERAEVESSLPPVEPEEPILIPELPEYLEAVDPTPESEVPDLEDTGLPLPPPKEPTPPPEIEQIPVEEPVIEQEAEEVQEVIEEEKKETTEEMENKLAEQLVRSVQSMVDPDASVEQQLSQMRAQLAALAQLPEVIQQTLELVSRQLNKMGHQETRMELSASHTESHSHQQMEVTQNHTMETIQEYQSNQDGDQYEAIQNGDSEQNEREPVSIEEVQDEIVVEPKQVSHERKLETPQMVEDEMRNEKMLKQQQQQKLEADARQIKQRSTPRVGKPTRMFGPLDPDSRPVVLPGGRRWRKTADVYNEQLIAETLQAQSELIRGKAMGFESDLLPYDDRINFMKYEKPPVSLDHLQNSETYKLVHDMDQPPLKKVEMLRPVIAEADYRERCRSATPSGAMKHLQIPQQFHP